MDGFFSTVLGCLFVAIVMGVFWATHANSLQYEKLRAEKQRILCFEERSPPVCYQLTPMKLVVEPTHD